MDTGMENNVVIQVNSAKPPSRARVAVALLFLINGMLFATWVSRIPGVQVAHGLSHGALGLGLLGMAGGALIAMPLGGWLSGRYGTSRVCWISTLLYAAALPGLGLAPSVAWLMLTLFCFGAAHGTLDVAMNAHAVEVEERYDRPIMSSFHALFSLGGLFGAALGAVFAALGFTPFVHFLGIAGVLITLAVSVALPGLLPASVTVRRTESESIQPHTGFSLPPKPLLILGILAFCVMLGEGAMADWTGIFLRQFAGASEGIAAAGYAAFSVAMALGRFFGDGLALRLGPVRLVRIGGFLAAAGLLAALVSAHSIVGLIGFAAVGAGFATIVPQVFTAAGRVPGFAPGPALAVVATTGYFGFLLGPPVIGFAAEWLGLRAALGLVVITSALLVVLAGRVRPERISSRQRTADPISAPSGLLAQETP
jgi:MFS family permease